MGAFGWIILVVAILGLLVPYLIVRRRNHGVDGMPPGGRYVSPGEAEATQFQQFNNFRQQQP